MEFPNFAIHLKNLRAFRAKTVYEVAEAVGVSHTYISQMENGKKLPSFKVLYPLVSYLGSRNDKGYINKVENLEYDGTKLLEEYANYKNMSSKAVINRYMEYVTEKLSEEVHDLFKTADSRKENKVTINRISKEITAINKPYYDLKWLLKQDEFFVFYGHEYDLQNVFEQKGSVSKNDVYNVLPDEDIKMISDLIEAYLSNKYKKVKNIGD